MEHIQELPSGKCLRKYSPEHPLFEAGTRLWATKYYQEAGSMQAEESVGKAHVQDQTSSMTCRLAKCNVNFQSIAAYEEHYDMVHRNICRECSRSFFSLRLLDIHISETHDAFFKILSKKKPMYVCLVDGCLELFQHDDKRTRHLIQVHQYPVSFSFHQRCKHKEKETSGTRENTGSEKANTKVEVDAETLKKREARKRRRQKKKKMFVSQNQDEGSEMFVDADATGNGSNEAANGSGTTDVNMEELEENMRKMRIPKSVHFGRKRRI